MGGKQVGGKRGRDEEEVVLVRLVSSMCMDALVWLKSSQVSR